MTLKKRLFQSNILMIALPIILAITISVITFYSYIMFTGNGKNALHKNDYIALSKDDAAKYLEDDDYTPLGDVMLYESEYGKCLLVFDSEDDIPSSLGDSSHQLYFIIWIVVLVVAVYLINRHLTQYIFKSVMYPIDTLSKGVHEIRDGDLSFRINYRGKDEFTEICNDFNEMAGRLQDMVNKQQKEELNRRELIAGISHDLRTPLTSIKAYIEGLEKDVADTPEKKERYISIIKNKTSELEYIINQLFLFSKLDIGDFPLRLETVTIGEELGSLIDEIKSDYHDKGLDITYEDTSDNANCSIDIIQFHNVIQNILGNSLKYKNKDIGKVSILCTSQDDSVTISITDNGPGVQKENLDRIFDVFYRGDAARVKPEMGSGLGLAISSKMIERFGGKIWAEAPDEEGLKIVITLKGTDKHDEENTYN